MDAGVERFSRDSFFRFYVDGSQSRPCSCSRKGKTLQNWSERLFCTSQRVDAEICHVKISNEEYLNTFWSFKNLKLPAKRCNKYFLTFNLVYFYWAFSDFATVQAILKVLDSWIKIIFSFFFLLSFRKQANHAGILMGF